MNERFKILYSIPSFVNQGEMLEMRVPETDEDCNSHVEMAVQEYPCTKDHETRVNFANYWLSGISETSADDLLLHLESAKSSLIELGYPEEYANRTVIDAAQKIAIEIGCISMGDVTKMVDKMIKDLQLLPDDDSKITATDIVSSERLRQMRLSAKHLTDIPVKKINETEDC